MQDVHQLALVGVDALHLDVKHGVRVQAHAVVRLNVACQSLTAQMLDFHQTLAEMRILDKGMQSVHLLRVAMPCA